MLPAWAPEHRFLFSSSTFLAIFLFVCLFVLPERDILEEIQQSIKKDYHIKKFNVFIIENFSLSNSCHVAESWVLSKFSLSSIIFHLSFLLLFIFLIPWSTSHAILLETLKISPPPHLIWILWLFSLSHLSFFASQIQNRTLLGQQER